MGYGKRKPAFTLIELLIVVVILGIIAAIVVPQFTIATDDARLSTLRTNLGTIRAQLQLYKLEHNDNFPTDNTKFEAQMTAKTDVAGAVGTDYGPYLMMIPENPFTGTNDIKAAKVVDAGGANKAAWYYLATDTRLIRANDTEAHHDDL